MPGYSWTGFLKQILITFFVCILPNVALADWRLGPGSEIFGGTNSAFGVTNLGVGGLGVLCRDDQPLIWTQGWATSATGPTRQDRFQISVDGQLYDIVGEHSPPDGLWTGVPTMELVEALRTGATALVTTKSAGSVSVSLRGSSRAISRVLSNCGSANTANGTPNHSKGTGQFVQLIAQMCGGGYRLEEGAEMAALLDDDDQPDLVLYWGGVTCDDQSKGRGAGFCGAALCTIEVAFTQTQSRQQILGVNPMIVARAFGVQALKATTQGRTCGDSAQTCDVFWIWNGAELEARR